MSDPMAEILAMFFAEADEGLEAAEQKLAELAAEGGDAEAINVVFRAVHSIKGSAGAFGFEALMQFAHRFETLLDELRAGRLPADTALWRLCERARDLLVDHVVAARDGLPPPADAAMLGELEAAAAGRAPGEPDALQAPASGPADPFGFAPELVDLDSLFAAAPAPAARILRLRPSAAALRNGLEPMLCLRELLAQGAAWRMVDGSSLPALAELDLTDARLTFEVALPDGMSQEAALAPFEFMPDDCAVAVLEEAAVAPPEASAPDLAKPTAEIIPLPPSKPVAAKIEAPKPAAKPESGGSRMIRVELDKLDRIVALVGELVISNAALEAAMGPRGNERPAALTDQDRLTRELQDAVMAVRAQPVRTAFDRVPKIIRELEAETGKRIRLVREGEGTEVDKTVIERIGEPLVHLIRNACDHGIEPPEDRAAAGKDPVGQITLSAESRGSKIILQVIDDGRGVNRERVVAKAVERGILSQEQASALTDAQIDDLIFAPGFSTAAAITNISGRGVGMDVVRKNVAALGGRVTISSEPGAGSTITMTLPLSLAIVDGMVVTCAGGTFVLPIAAVVECIALEPGTVERLSANSGVLSVRGEYLPVVPLARSLGLGRAEGLLAIIVECDRHGRVALLVDAVIDQRQIVIKNIETNYQSVPDISGATILGDGQVALILDVEALTGRIQRLAA